jgi:hypothetical protein
MASPSGGRWLFSTTGTPVVLNINDGVKPVFPTPQGGAFNIEVFTNATVNGLPGVPNPDNSSFQSSMADAGGTLDTGFLTGTNLRLGSGNLLAVDHGNDSVASGATTSGGISPSKITLGTGNQTVVGAKFDTLVGGQAPGATQILSALLGNETVVGGTAVESIWGGANDSIVAGSALGQQISVSGAGTTVVAGISGSATLALAAQNTVTAIAGNQVVGIGAGASDLINLTGNAGVGTFVTGAAGDTITGGGAVGSTVGGTAIEAAAGGMLINIGAGGITAVDGSSSTVAGNTITGGAGGFNFNPNSVVGKGDFINLSGSTGTATINAFAFQSTTIASHDTILATNNSDLIFGGDGDRIGTGNGPVVGGTHQWTADTVAGSAVGFGSNDSVNSTTYVGNTATRGTVAGTSSAVVTVGGFNTANDFLFYQGENLTTNNAIVATSQATVAGGLNSTLITLPDGTLMTLVGVTQAQLSAALTAGTLFK